MNVDNFPKRLDEVCSLGSSALLLVMGFWRNEYLPNAKKCEARFPEWTIESVNEYIVGRTGHDPRVISRLLEATGLPRIEQQVAAIERVGGIGILVRAWQSGSITETQLGILCKSLGSLDRNSFRERVRRLREHNAKLKRRPRKFRQVCKECPELRGQVEQLTDLLQVRDERIAFLEAEVERMGKLVLTEKTR